MAALADGQSCGLLRINALPRGGGIGQQLPLCMGGGAVVRGGRGVGIRRATGHCYCFRASLLLE